MKVNGNVISGDSAGLLMVFGWGSRAVDSYPEPDRVVASKGSAGEYVTHSKGTISNE
jgi:hypothetical protein